MQLAISGQLLGHTHPLDEIVEIVHSLGVRAIDLWPHNLVGGDTPEEQDDYSRKELGVATRTLRDTGTSVACVTLGFSSLRVAADRGAASGTQLLRDAVDAAVVLDAPVVNCYLAGLAPELFVELARPAATYAGTKHVTIVLENEAHDASGTARGVRAIVDAIGSPHFGALYDPCNFYQANEEPFPYAYEVLGGLIRYVHLKGGRRYEPSLSPGAHRGGTMRDQPDRHIGYVALPDGVVNAAGLLRRLRADGYEGFVTLEPHVPPTEALGFYGVEVPFVHSLLADACR